MTAEQFARLLETIEGGASAWWSPFITPVGTVIAALLAGLFAWMAIRNQRAIAKRRNTIDLIVKFETDSSYQTSVQFFRDLRAKKLLPHNIVFPENDDDYRKARNYLNTFWNYHEIMALAMRRDTIDIALFRRWWGVAYVNAWNESIEVVNKLRGRSSSPRPYQNFEIAARHIAKTLNQKGYSIQFIEPLWPNAKKPFVIKDD